LFIVLVDARTESPEWVGAATAKVLENPDIEVVKKRLEHAVINIVRTLPR
jgi:hypothetical protein